MEDDYEEDSEPPPELLRLVEQEARELKPHQEDVVIINLGDCNEKREVKIGTGMLKEIQGQLCVLLGEFRNIFA